MDWEDPFWFTVDSTFVFGDLTFTLFPWRPSSNINQNLHDSRLVLTSMGVKAFSTSIKPLSFPLLLIVDGSFWSTFPILSKSPFELQPRPIH